MSVYAPLLGSLWRTLESYGVDPGLAIDEALYRPGRRKLLVERISFSSFDAAMTRVVDLVKDPAMGIRTAQFIHPSDYGALGHAWLTSSSLRHALQRLVRFQSMVNEQYNIQLQELPDRIRVIYQSFREFSQPDFFGDAHQAQVLAMCRMNFGTKLAPIEVNLKRSKPSDPSPWFEFFGPGVKFDQAEISLAISDDQADKPLTGANPELVSLHDAATQRHLMTLDRGNILNRSRMRLMDQLPSGRVTEDDLACALNMSTRTLHRKLRENDMTFRSLLEQVRMDLSKQYISNRNYHFTEIAFLLGYTDISAFSRAFKTWFGHSPTQAREQARAH